MTDRSFDCMGTTVRLLVADDETADECRAFLEHFDATLSRFRPHSELSRLNASPRQEVAASPLLRAAVSAGVAAAALTRGLVDPTLTGALERNGYDRSRREPELPITEALKLAPPRAPAKPDPRATWQRISVTPATIVRPPGVRLDTGGTGKGLAADLLAQGLGGHFAVDCGGDLRVGGTHTVHVTHPLTGATAHTLTLSDSAVATSGIDRRLWRGPDHRPRHHLLDPSTHRPAWTGLIQATAQAPTALEAEARAKAALLSGPDDAHRWLRRHGGVLIHDDGATEVLGLEVVP